MGEQAILERVIEKAMTNGYNPPFADKAWWTERYRIIFSHEFAKALWGYEPYLFGEWSYQHEREGDRAKIIRQGGYSWWQYHLQQMVIADNPIAYLEPYL